MKKKLLLVTAFLAIAGTAMAVTTDEIGKLYHETSAGKMEMYEKEMAKAIADLPKRSEVEAATKKMEVKLADIDVEEYVKAAKEVEEEMDKNKEQFTKELENKLNKLSKEKEKLATAINTKLANPATTAEERKKLTTFKEGLEVQEVALTKTGKLIAKKNELEKAIPENPESVNEDTVTKAIKMITPNSMVDDNIITSNENETYRQYFIARLNNEDLKDGLAEIVVDYKEAKELVEGLESNYKEELKKEKNEDKIKEAKEGLDLAKEDLLELKNEANDLLKIAGTDIDSYLKLSEEDRVKAEASIVEKIANYKNEKDFFAGVAHRYAYGDLNGLSEEEAEGMIITNTALRITENAINIENNKKAIARNAQDIKDLRKDHNRGMAQMAAMASVDFGNVKARTVKVGAGIGQHSSETAVAVGVAVTPTDALMVNAKWSTSASSIKKSTLGLGATYEFNF